MNKKYEKLFETITLPNGVELKNRFVLAPLTHTSSNDDGTISDVEIPYIEKRSKDVGLAIMLQVMLTILVKLFRDNLLLRMIQI